MNYEYMKDNWTQINAEKADRTSKLNYLVVSRKAAKHAKRGRAWV